VAPRQLTDWFWVAYIDAYDWVVEPNVLAMGTYGVGDLMTTKPYICGAKKHKPEPIASDSRIYSLVLNILLSGKKVTPELIVSF
jgi:hypothetical protein